MNTESALKTLVIILMVLLVLSYIGPKIKEVFQKTADRIETVDYQQTMAVRK